MLVDWVKVGVGDVVKGAKDGLAWTVLSRGEDGSVTIENGKRRHTLMLSGPVEVIWTADEFRAAAEAAVKVMMPGSVEICVQDTESKLWTAPNAFPDAGSLLAHALVLHGKILSEKPLPDMHAEHSAWHSEGDIATPHVHVKDWYRKRP